MATHWIHLRGPWHLEWNDGGALSTQKIRLPAQWNDLFATRLGRVRLTRAFHRPTNLGPSEEVDLVFQQWPGVWAVSLNQRPIGRFQDSVPESPARFTITSLLQPTNLLSAETRIEQKAGQNARRGLIGKIALAIRGD